MSTVFQPLRNARLQAFNNWTPPQLSITERFLVHMPQTQLASSCGSVSLCFVTTYHLGTVSRRSPSGTCTCSYFPRQCTRRRWSKACPCIRGLLKLNGCGWSVSTVVGKNEGRFDWSQTCDIRRQQGAVANVYFVFKIITTRVVYIKLKVDSRLPEARSHH